jgi:hypothetical protein
MALTVVHDLGGALVGAGFDEVDAEAPFAADDRGRIHPEAPHLAQEGVRNGVVRQHRHIARRQAVGGHRHRDVGLPAAEGGHELGCLKEALEPGRGEAQHDFSERDNNLAHMIHSPIVK